MQYPRIPRSKLEDAPTLLKVPKSDCPYIWIPLPKHKRPKSWSSMEDSVVPLERNLYGHPLAGLLCVILEHVWEEVPNWECLFVNREEDHSCLCMWTRQNWLERHNIKIMDINNSRLPGCDGQAADAVSAYTQVKMEDVHKLFKIPKSESPDIWIRLPRHKWPKSWSSMEDLVVPLERNLYGHPFTGLLWERQFEKIPLKHDWGKIPNWECLFVHREKGLFLSVYVDDIKLAGKKQNLDPMWKILLKDVDLGEPTSYLDHVYVGCTQRLCQISKETVDNYKSMFEIQNFCWCYGKIQKLKVQGNLWQTLYLHGLVTRTVMRRNAWKDCANLRTKQLNSHTKSQHHALTTVNLRKKKWDLLENCHKYAPNLF